MTEEIKDFSKLTKKQLIEKLKEQSKVSQGVSTSVAPTVEDDHQGIVDRVERSANRQNPHSIPFKETCDHKNIMLYTALNKRVGPLHPNNAVQTIKRWKRAGIQLYDKPRTPEQIEAFKQTDEYIVSHQKHIAMRNKMREQSEKGKAEHMIKEVARVTAEAVAGVRK